jgi:hypothetical protein
MKATFWFPVVLAIIGLAFGSGMALAQEEKFEFHPSATLNEILQKYVGKDVYLLLSSGRELHGRLEKAGANVVHLSKISGRDFYDAVVQTNQIEGFEFRARSGK